MNLKGISVSLLVVLVGGCEISTNLDNNDILISVDGKNNLQVASIKLETSEIVKQTLPLRNKADSIINTYHIDQGRISNQMVFSLFKGIMDAKIEQIQNELSETAYNQCFNSSITSKKDFFWSEPKIYLNSANYHTCVGSYILSAELDNSLKAILKGKQFDSLDKDNITYQQFMSL